MKTVSVKEHSLDIPVNVTKSITWEEINNKISVSKPTNLKIILSCTELQRRTFDERAYVDSLKKIKNVADVKLAYDIEKPLHIRCASITESKSAVDKFIKYAEVDKINYDKELLDKIDYLEKSQEIKYVTPKHTFTLLKIKLRGAIGIKNGSGKDEVEVDFSKLPDGIIALCGENGKGKTTLLNILAGLLFPDSGEIMGVPSKIAFVFQEDRLCEDFSAMSNIIFQTLQCP